MLISKSYSIERLKVGIIPINIYFKKEIKDLRSDINEMMIKSIEKGGFAIIEDSKIKVALSKYPKIGDKELREIGKELNADIVIRGNITIIKDRFSIDFEVMNVHSKEASKKLFTEGSNILNIYSKAEELMGKIGGIISKEAKKIIPPKETIKNVYVKGNHRIEKESILSKIRSKKGGIFSYDIVREDIKSIYRMGYFKDIQVDVKDTPDGKEITFIVYEKPIIKEIRIIGNKEFKEDKIKEAIEIKPHSIFNISLVKESINKIRKLYGDEGYYYAQIDYKLDELKNNQVRLIFKIKENKKIFIKGISFVGNKAIKDKELKKFIRTKKRGLLSWLTGTGVLKRDLLDEDVERIKALYYNKGYIQVEVDKPEVNIKKKGIYITYRIKEGHQFRIGRIDFKGDNESILNEMRQVIKIKPNDIFNREAIAKDILTLTEKYSDRGYAFVNITPLSSIDPDKRLVNLTFNIEKGDVVYIDKINITGNTRTRDKVIRRELKIKEGDIYNGSALKRSKEKVNYLGFFSEVNLTTKRKGINKLDVNINVKERQTGAFSIGGGYSSVDQLVATFQISQGNLFGRGQKLNLTAEIGGRRNRYSLGFTEPRLMDTEWLFGFDIYNDEREYTDFTRKATGGNLRFGYPLGEFTRWDLEYRFEDVEVKDVSFFASRYIREQIGSSTTSSITGNISRDTRNDRFDPSKGSLNSFSLEIAGGPFSGDNDFVTLIAGSRWFFPAFKSSVLMLNGTFGYAKSYGGDELPIFEKFFPGGLNSVRGYKARSLGPKDPETGDEIGGNKEIILNIEYIFPLVKEAGLKGLFFFDMGNAFNNGENIDIGDLKKGVGAGIRWLSPMGPLRFEWGYALDKEPGEKSSDFQFSIGSFY
jgi:outer membrane protein insertion porin family